MSKAKKSAIVVAVVVVSWWFFNSILFKWILGIALLGGAIWYFKNKM